MDSNGEGTNEVMYTSKALPMKLRTSSRKMTPGVLCLNFYTGLMYITYVTYILSQLQDTHLLIA